MKMKTPLMFVAACVVALCHLDRAHAAVESDIVGYTTMKMEANKWYQIGFPFQSLDATEETTSYKISEAFKSGFNDKDALFVLDPEDCTYPIILQWHDTLDDAGVAGWGMYGIPLAQDETIEAGYAVLIHKRTTNDVVFSGKVDLTPTTTIKGDGAWSLVSLPYPAETKLNELSWDGIAQGDALFIMDPVDATYSVIKQWHDNPDNSDKAGWGMYGIPLMEEDVTLAPGAAILVNKRSKGEATVSLKK